jgi:DNA-binding NarL/FixJ family response regulator
MRCWIPPSPGDLVRHFVGTPAGHVRIAGLAHPGVQPDASARLGELTDREAQVLRLIAEGCSNAEIGDLLHIAESTAKTHVKRILAQVAARDRAQAVVIAYQGGLMSGTP